VRTFRVLLFHSSFMGQRGQGWPNMPMLLSDRGGGREILFLWPADEQIHPNENKIPMSSYGGIADVRAAVLWPLPKRQQLEPPFAQGPGP
jgi:hypothetical protein